VQSIEANMSQHGFPAKQIYEHFEMFEKETKAEREKCTSFNKFNEDILNTKKDAPIAKIYKGIFVGNILLNNAREEKHAYKLAMSPEFIIIVPFGPIQSVVHIMAIPKIPLYNVVSLGMGNVLLMQKMQAALVRVITDVLKPGSIPQRIYLRSLSEGIDQKSTDLTSIRITQKRNNLDTLNMNGAKATQIIQGMLEDFYNGIIKRGIPLEQVISTDLHLHPTNSVGLLHMHGWIAEPGMITDNGMKLEYKNTPLNRIFPVLGKFRGGEVIRRKIKVTVTNKEIE